MVSGGTIMILGATQALFFVSLLISKKKKSTSDFLLVAYLLLLTIHLLYYFVMFFSPEDVPKLIGTLGFSLVILHTPIFFIYVRSLGVEEAISIKEVFLHTLTYIVYNLILLISESHGLLALNPRNGFLGISTEYPIFYQSGQALAIITVAYLFWGFYILRKYRKKVGNNQSNLTAYQWMHFLVLSFLVYFVSIYAVLTLALDMGFILPSQVFYYVSFIIMAYVFALGFFGIRLQTIFIGYKPSKTETKYAKSGLTSNQIDQIENDLKNSMEKDALFLNPDISLPELASMLEVKAPYLSQVINQRFQTNFFDFINHYRVEEVKKRMADSAYRHLSLLGIALDCGFKSKSSFNKSFKRTTGQTPSDFKRSLEASE